MPPATELSRPKPRLPRKHPLRPQHRRLRNPRGPPHRCLPRGPRLCRPHSLQGRRVQHPPLLRGPALPPHHRAPVNASTVRRSSAAWPRSTASTSAPFPAPALAAVSASKTSKPISPVARNHQPKPPSQPRLNIRRLLPRRSAPPLLLHRPPRLPVARFTWPSSPPCRAKQCISATTKCNP